MLVSLITLELHCRKRLAVVNEALGCEIEMFEDCSLLHIIFDGLGIYPEEEIVHDKDGHYVSGNCRDSWHDLFNEAFGFDGEKDCSEPAIKRWVKKARKLCEDAETNRFSAN